MASPSLIAELFRERFGEAPAVIASAPGRVNLIGEHTDYNDGFVLPLAIESRAYVAVGTRPDGQSVVRSRELADEITITSDDCGAARDFWHDAPRGVLCEFSRIDRDPKVGASPTCDLVMPHHSHASVLIASDVPSGAGLSSSAAVEIALARALAELEGVQWVPLEMAQLAQRVEHEFLGVRSGIMDPLVAAAATAGQAMRIDCRTFDVTRVTIPAEVRVVVLDTGSRRTLGAGEYNDRRSTCEAVARMLREQNPSIRALRDATLRDLETVLLAEHERRRARHVITENARVDRFISAMDAGDFSAAGAVLNESHASLRDDYMVSSTHLDTITELARAHPACFGARLTGAGFGGCAVALVQREHADRFIADVQPRYEAATYKKSAFFVARASAGARLEPL